jgi:DNA-binding CsgD family transcriptional regulator/N-acetylneuraminic acid mutarotase
MESDPNGATLSPPGANGAALSEREHEILRLVATGASNKQIAQQLVISPNTVKVHLRNIFSKIGAASRTEAALYAMRAGLVQIPGAQPSQENAPEAAGNSEPVALQAEAAAAAQSAPQSQLGPAVSAPQRIPLWLPVAGLLVAAVIILVTIWLTRPGPAAATPTVSAPTAVPQWQSKTQMPSARSGLAATSYADLAYAMGGESAGGISGANERFDPASNSWAKLASMPLPAADIASAALGGLIYVPGGRLPSGEITNTLQLYDPRQDHWEMKAPLPQPLSGYALAVYEGKLYVFGGWTGTDYTNTVLSYDPLSDKWTGHTSMPTPRAFSGAASAAGKIYVMGGTAGGAALATNEAFSPDAEANGGAAWTTMAAIPSGRARLAVTSVADIVHVLGGDDITGPQVALEYLPQQDVWKQIETPRTQPWSRMGLVVIGTNLYAFGGLVGKTISGAQWTYQALYTIAVPIVQ